MKHHHHHRWFAALLSPFVFMLMLGRLSAAEQPGLLKSEFIFEKASFPSCHASTIVETIGGKLVTAWFGGTAEKNPDVGIWLARLEKGTWTEPREVANGVQSDNKREPCWNPVLFQPKNGPLLLFYKVGPSPATWWGMLRTSTDDGQTWSEAKKLPDGILGPIKNKPIQLEDGTILCGSSVEGLKPPPAWQIHFERSKDQGATWETISVPTSDTAPAAIQPSILIHSDGSLQAVGRTRAGKVFTTTSSDKGQTWEPLKLTSLPNPNSGTDAVTLKDGRHLLIYNHTVRGRTPLSISLSTDGRDWQAALVLESEPGEYSYPAIIQTADGLVHATYTWKRQRIKHAVIDPTKLQLQPLVNGDWPK